MNLSLPNGRFFCGSKGVNIIITTEKVGILSRNMKGAELNSTSKGIHARRGQLTIIDNQLRALNEYYPEERKKRPIEMDPEFREKREALIGIKLTLAPRQVLAKAEIRDRLAHNIRLRRF